MNNKELFWIIVTCLFVLLLSSCDNLFQSEDQGGDNSLPNALISVDKNPARVDEVLNFDASESSDNDGGIESYSWNFGDGFSDTGITVDHSYTYPGTFTVELKVTDSSGASDSETMDITVRETPGSADVTINLISPEEYTINLDGFNRTLVKPDEKANVVVDISGGADYYKWYLDGELFSEGESNDELLLNAGTFENGIHYLLVCVQKNGRLYSGRFQFTVEN